MRDARSKIDIPQARWCCDEPVNAGPTKIPTPTNPPNKPSQTSGVGRAAVPLSQPSNAISIGTGATQKGSQSGRDPFLGEGDAAVSAEKQTTTDNRRRPPCQSFRFRRSAPT